MFDSGQMLKKLLTILFLLFSLGAVAQACPQLLNPLAGATDVPVETVIAWEEVPGVPGYRISLGTTPGGDDIVSNELVGSATVYVPELGLPENTQIFVTITLFFFDNISICELSSIFFGNNSIIMVKSSRPL